MGLFRKLLQNEITWLLLVVGIVLSIQGNFSDITQDLQVVRTTMAQVEKNTDGLSEEVKELKREVSDLKAAQAALKAQIADR